MVWPCSHCLLSLSVSSLSVCVLAAGPSLLQRPLLPPPQFYRLLSVPQSISPAGWSSSDTVSSLAPSRTPLLNPARFCKGSALGLPPLAATVLPTVVFSDHFGTGWEGTPGREHFFPFLTSETHGLCGMFPSVPQCTALLMGHGWFRP